MVRLRLAHGTDPNGPKKPIQIWFRISDFSYLGYASYCLEVSLPDEIYGFYRESFGTWDDAQLTLGEILSESVAILRADGYRVVNW